MHAFVHEANNSKYSFKAVFSNYFVLACGKKSLSNFNYALFNRMEFFTFYTYKINMIDKSINYHKNYKNSILTYSL